ncbi:TadE/TadG family type IV pilus assembly protein [Pseudomonas sp. Gutcm_11s]|uniref:TadE/TadG family type IV pilus assembly protein n=1 Tax=Pseudomonas sp. Gutcm_11s TaxID=3026088 RepID=UPI0023613218|nr:TadE/TadG family type IV pilus assembly protein [Pseudomonas sp. Gutcm_11s]MDD0843770.1 TadE/TadG family type IV pilus assembly protein [Pseudomonas sp. Gutcm_11s]
MIQAMVNSSRQGGVAMVEFAVALPLLVLLLLGIGEFGRMLFQYNSLLQASRDAGRYAASQAYDATLGRLELGSTLQSEIKNVAVYGVPSSTAGFGVLVPCLTVDDVAVTAPDSEHVQVSITFAFRSILGNLGGSGCTAAAASLPNLFGDPIPLALTLTSSVVMRAL